MELESWLHSWINDLVNVEMMCVSWRYLSNAYILTGWELCGWTDGRRHSEPTQSTCGVRACAGVYVDNVPCAATPPFPIFIEHCLSLQPWQQKMTNGRTVEMLRLCVRLNDWASFLDRKSNQCQWIGWLAFTYCILPLLKTSNNKCKMVEWNIGTQI